MSRSQDTDTAATERLATGLAKVESVSEFVSGLLDVGERVVLFAHHHEVFDAYAKHFSKYRPVFITGRDTEDARTASVTSFRTGATPLVVMSSRSSAGIDGLQEQGTACVFGEIDWSPSVHSQCHSRLKRLGAAGRTMNAYALVCRSSYDIVISDALRSKSQQIDGVMGVR